MTLSEIYSGCIEKEVLVNSKTLPVISFEIFPPKDDVTGEKLDKLLFHLKILKNYNPAFISLTYGAGGTTQDVSIDIIKKIHNELNLRVMPHFTCVGSSTNQVEEYLEVVQNYGIKDILALRGDIPAGMSRENFDFKYANELVKFIKAKTNLSIGVAAYPEGHIECSDFDVDLNNLKNKVNEGADVIFTQMFFDSDKYFSFVERARNIGINIPIIPGILAIRSFQQLEKMLSMAKVTVPKKLMDELSKFKDDNEAVKKIGIEFASEQCQKLIEFGVNGLHFYTLNTSTSVSKILDNICN